MMRYTSTWTRLLATTVISGAAAVSFAGAAYGQTTTPPPATETDTDGGQEVPTGESTLGGDNAEASQEEAATQSITVTGSRIARPDLTSVSPVTVVDAEQVELTGTTTLETLLNDLPQVIPGNTRVSNNAGGENFATLDLRGLGPGRTLILIDGERIPPSTTTGVVDISQVPAGLIQRIDVVTGGATAVYGSDAVAGVINFVLKQDFEGVELTGQLGIAENGAGFNSSISGLFGGNFADNRGNITLYTSYTDREAVGQSRFDYSRTSAALFFDPVNGGVVVTDDPNAIPAGFSTLVAGGSATAPQGSFQASTLAGTQFRTLSTLLPGTFGAADTDCNPATAGAAIGSTGTVSFNPNGALSPFFSGGGPRCAIAVGTSSRYNFAPANLLVTPFDRFQFTALGRYDFSDSTRGRIYASFSDSEQTVNLAPTPATGIVVPVTSAFIPADLAAALASRTFFTRTAFNDTTGAGAVGSLGGRFTAATTAAGCQRDADADGVADFTCTAVTPANFGTAPIQAVLPGVGNPALEPFIANRRFTETGPRIGVFNSQSFNIRGTLEHEISDAFTVQGVASYGRVDNDQRGIGNINRTAVLQGLNNCTNAAGVVNGPGILPNCVPINIFGANTLDAAQLNFVRIDTQQQEEFEQVRFAVNVSGSLFELPGGPVGIAVGAEYRRDRADSVVDDAQRTGDIFGFNAVQAISGQISVKEVYGEVRLPILGGDGFPDLLAVELGARYSDYSTVGGLFNYKAALEFAPVPWARLRATYNRAARAPNVFELFQAGDQGFPSFVDPCNANNPLQNTALCLATGVPAGVLPTFAQTNQQVQVFSFGNPDLEEEKAETYTIGGVFTPTFIPIGKLSLTVDYYNIEITNRVATLGSAFFLQQCYSGNTDPTTDACSRIVRDPGSGQITSIDLSRTNSAVPLKTAGIDVGFNWTIPFSDIFGGGDGRIRISNLFTYVDTYKIGSTEFADTVFSGIGGVTFKYGNTLTVGYEDDVFTAQARYVWRKGAKQQFPSAELEGFFEEGDSARIPDLHDVGLSLRWKVNERFVLTGIIDNILDKYPPQTATGTFEQANTNINFYDPYALGRTYTIQAQVRF